MALAVALKQQFFVSKNNNGSKQRKTKRIIFFLFGIPGLTCNKNVLFDLTTTLSARNINHELRTTGQEAKEKRRKKNFKTSRTQPPK
jgi:hypothetical protein